MEQFLSEQKEFSEKVFIHGTTSSVMEHLRRETREIERKPDDLSEWADVFLLFLDGLWRNGFTFTQLFKAAQTKLKINKSRKWKKPDAQGVVEHVK